jgi:Outer membrane protein and related peptidoglycan-associated (lipo)proteins
MITSFIRKPAMAAGITLMALVGTGCATKKYVRNQVDPVAGRVSEVEKTNAQQATAISQLENEVSQVDEKAMAADKRAAAAAEEAAKANREIASVRSDVGKVGQELQGLRTETQQNIAAVERDLNPANYKLVLEENVLFRFGRSQLTPEAKEQLNHAARSIAALPHYAIEVQGFTDPTGDPNYNLNLSRERAQAVVRYLATEHQIPLRRIHVLGVGPLKLEDRSLEARKQARKVEIRVFAPESAAAKVQTGSLPSTR